MKTWTTTSYPNDFCSSAQEDIVSKFCGCIRRSIQNDSIPYLLANGKSNLRTYLDSAASTLPFTLNKKILDRYTSHYSNTHTEVHFGAQVSSVEYKWAHQMILKFLHAPPNEYECFFVGAGTTGGMNRISKLLKEQGNTRDVVISSMMEHHSNDLPHRGGSSRLLHVRLEQTGDTFGAIDLAHLERLLKQYKGRVKYVTITGASNVTGIINPIYEMAKMVHAYDTLFIVDAAQLVAHVPIYMKGVGGSNDFIDGVIFSGHKIYAPGSPGVVVLRNSILKETAPVELGGGMVKDVYTDTYIETNKFPDREEAGTPNIGGALSLASVLNCMHRLGMQRIEEEEKALIGYAIEKLQQVDGLILYGDVDLQRTPRVGVVSFNLKGVNHQLLASILNDYFNISVRNGCFCAHPYVRELITEQLSSELEEGDLSEVVESQKGMVRVSFGIYNNSDDVDYLVESLIKIVRDVKTYQSRYVLLNGRYQHASFQFEAHNYFSTEKAVEEWLAEQLV